MNECLVALREGSASLGCQIYFLCPMLWSWALFICICTCGFAGSEGLVRAATVCSLVNGSMDAADGAVEAGLSENLVGEKQVSEMGRRVTTL